MKRIVQVTVGIIGAALLIYFILKLFPNDVRVIEKNTKRLAALASFTANELPLSRLQNTRELANFFATDAQVAVDVPGASQSISGREELFQMAMAARSSHPGAQVDLLDVTVALDPGKKDAIVDTTLKAKLANQSELVIQELKITWRKLEGDWLIQKIETVRTVQ